MKNNISLFAPTCKLVKWWTKVCKAHFQLHIGKYSVVAKIYPCTCKERTFEEASEKKDPKHLNRIKCKDKSLISLP